MEWADRVTYPARWVVSDSTGDGFEGADGISFLTFVETVCESLPCAFGDQWSLRQDDIVKVDFHGMIAKL